MVRVVSARKPKPKTIEAWGVTRDGVVVNTSVTQTKESAEAWRQSQFMFMSNGYRVVHLVERDPLTEAVVKAARNLRAIRMRDGIRKSAHAECLLFDAVERLERRKK